MVNRKRKTNIFSFSHSFISVTVLMNVRKTYLDCKALRSMCVCCVTFIYKKFNIVPCWCCVYFSFLSSLVTERTYNLQSKFIRKILQLWNDLNLNRWQSVNNYREYFFYYLFSSSLFSPYSLERTLTHINNIE